MRVLLLFLIIVIVIFQFNRADPSSCRSGGCKKTEENPAVSVHRDNNPQHSEDFQNLTKRSQRNIINSTLFKIKEKAIQLGQKLHVIKKRAENASKDNNNSSMLNPDADLKSSLKSKNKKIVKIRSVSENLKSVFKFMNADGTLKNNTETNNNKSVELEKPKSKRQINHYHQSSETFKNNSNINYLEPKINLTTSSEIQNNGTVKMSKQSVIPDDHHQRHKRTISNKEILHKVNETEKKITTSASPQKFEIKREARIVKSTVKSDYFIIKNENSTTLSDLIKHHSNHSNPANISRIANQTSKISENNEKLEKSTTQIKRQTNGNNTYSDEDPRYLLVHDVPPYRKKRNLVKNFAEKASRNASDTGTTLIRNLRKNLRKKRDIFKENLKEIRRPESSLFHNVSSEEEPKGILITRTARNAIFEEADTTNDFSSQISANQENAAYVETAAKLNAGQHYRMVENDDDDDEDNTLSKSLNDFVATEDLNRNLPSLSSQEFYSTTEEHPTKAMNNIRNVSKPHTLQCACEMYVDGGNEKPQIFQCFLDTLYKPTREQTENLCFKTCSKMSKSYFIARQVVFCTHSLQNGISILKENTTVVAVNIKYETSDTIFCQILPEDFQRPLQFIISWINIILMDVVVCMTSLGMLSLYLICFSGWRKNSEPALPRKYKGIILHTK